IVDAGHDNYFEFNVGPHSWKQFLFPPQLTIASGSRTDSGWSFGTTQAPPTRYALLGARACELAAIAVQDRVFLQGPYVDPVYKARRQAALIIAVNCTVAAATCFCQSTQTGPQCQHGFDLALTELADGFLAEIGSNRGRQLLKELKTSVATEQDINDATELQQRATKQLSKQLDTRDLRHLLLDNLDHPHWDEVAQRCLSCTNCTMVCPTCFCSSVSEVSNLEGDRVQRVRNWDSCFNIDFSYTAGGVVRNDRRSRFRQWLTHKLASWHDQFESSGCVGCGRCITWCPVGIDLTEEVAKLRSQPNTNRQLPIVEPAKTVCAVPGSEA
ncbi:MAG: 4Fe-4S dicluster domain-containing protein, partial [Aureliella sp.]